MNKKIIEHYLYNKSLKCGEKMICPICGKEFLKKQYSQAFCSTSCKDDYHNKKGDRHKPNYYRKYNMKHPERLERLKYFKDNSYYDEDDSWMMCDNPQLGI